MPHQSALDPESAGSAGAPAGVLPQPSPSTPARGQPQRRKIEYVPTVREIGWGGRDVPAIAEEHARASTRRILRDLNEWGSIEVDALAMSVRSRIATELSYALTTLTILSTMRGANGNGFSASICPDLIDELLDLVADVALGGVESELADAEEGEDAAEKITTHKELVNKVLEDGSRPFAALDRKQGAKPEELGHKQRPGDLVLAVMNILRNLSVFPENQEFLARHERASSMSSGGTAISPVVIEITSGKNATRKVTITRGISVGPSMTTRIGAIATFGTDCVRTSNG